MANENLVFIAYARSEGSSEPAQSRQSLRCSSTQSNDVDEVSDHLVGCNPDCIHVVTQARFKNKYIYIHVCDKLNLLVSMRLVTYNRGVNLNLSEREGART